MAWKRPRMKLGAFARRKCWILLRTSLELPLKLSSAVAIVLAHLKGISPGQEQLQIAPIERQRKFFAKF